MIINLDKKVYFYFLGNKLSGKVIKFNGNEVVVLFKLCGQFRTVKLYKSSIFEK